MFRSSWSNGQQLSEILSLNKPVVSEVPGLARNASGSILLPGCGLQACRLMTSDAVLKRQYRIRVTGHVELIHYCYVTRCGACQLLLASTPSDLASECVQTGKGRLNAYRNAVSRPYEVERSSYPADTCPCCKDDKFWSEFPVMVTYDHTPI